MSSLTCLTSVVIVHLFGFWLLRGRAPGTARPLALLGMLAAITGLFLVAGALESPLPLEGGFGTLIVFSPLLALLAPVWLAALAKP